MNSIRILLGVLALLFATLGYSSQLYQGEALVADQSAEARSKALGQALLEVAVKVSGKPDASSNSVVLSAASAPDRYMQRYEYRQELVRENGAPVAKLYLKGTFYPASVQQLLQRAGYAVWGANRPVLIVYLFEQGQALSAEMRTAMLERAAERGITVRFPGGVDISELADTDALVKRLTSAGQTILLGEVGSSMIISDGQSSESIEPSLDGLSDRLVPVLSRRITAANNAPPQDVMTEVAGLSTPNQYAKAMQSVMAISGVKSAQLIGARDNRLLMRLSVKGGIRQLLQGANSGSTFQADALNEEGAALLGSSAVLLSLK